MHKILADKISKTENLTLLEKEMKRYFVETFKQCDDAFLKLAAKKLET